MLGLVLLVACGGFPDALPDALPDAVEVAQVESSKADDLPLPENTDTGLSLVMVTSKTCGPCQTMKSILDALRGGWKVRYVDFDSPAVAQWLEVYGITAVPYYVTYRGHEALEVAQGVMTAGELQGWLDRLERGDPPPSGGRFVRSTAQDSLKPVDREYLQMRLTPGSCGMLGCMAHGGGWVTETMPAKPDEEKPKGHWEERQSGCPSGNCPSGGCPSQKVWVADPDPTGTVPWPTEGSIFRRRR